MLSLIAAVENYRNIKLIVSCRSIYLQEVLDEDIVSRMALVEQKGFEHVEIEAMRQFGEYYGIHLNFDYLLHQEYRNPLYLKMLCEVAQTQENFHAEAGDLMKLMKDFFVMKDKKISKEISISVREHIVQQILGMVVNSITTLQDYEIKPCRRNSDIKASIMLFDFIVVSMFCTKVAKNTCSRICLLRINRNSWALSPRYFAKSFS